MLKTDKYDVDKIFRLTVGIIIFLIFFSLVYYLRTILIPFVIAIILANVLDPLVDFFEKFKIPRVLSVLIVFTILGLFLFFLFYLGIPYIINELSSFNQIFPNYIRGINDFIQNKLNFFQSGNISEDYQQYVDKFFENIQATEIINKLLGYITGLFSQLINLLLLLVGLVIIIVYVFFLLRDIDKLKKRWPQYIPQKYRETAQEFIRESISISANFFRGQFTIVIILGVLFSIGFSLIDLRLAIVFGFTAGFLNFIPTFGTIIAIIPGVLLAVGRSLEPGGGDPLLRIAGVLIVFASVQIIQDLILTPTIMGKRTGLRPATILFSVLVWGKLLGFLGIILAIPLTCLTKVYFAKIILKENPEIKELESGNVSK